MFRKNEHHLQASLFSDLDHLSKKARERLETSWAGVFRREFFSRLDESPFAVLYGEGPSRPNIPVNVLVGLEALKSGFGWSDQEMHDAFLFDLQTRYALGYENIGEGDFDLRTVYHFRRRLQRYFIALKNVPRIVYKDVSLSKPQAFPARPLPMPLVYSQSAGLFKDSVVGPEYVIN